MQDQEYHLFLYINGGIKKPGYKAVGQWLIPESSVKHMKRFNEPEKKPVNASSKKKQPLLPAVLLPEYKSVSSKEKFSKQNKNLKKRGMMRQHSWVFLQIRVRP